MAGIKTEYNGIIDWRYKVLASDGNTYMLTSKTELTEAEWQAKAEEIVAATATAEIYLEAEDGTVI